MTNKSELVILSGSTARITCKFYNFSDELVDPTIIKFVIYDSKYNLLEQITLGEADRLSIGTYFYDYKAPKDAGKRFYYEFYGEINGNVTLDRGAIRTTFM